MKYRLRLALAIILIAITVVAFYYYISGHRYLLTKLAHTPSTTIIWLFGLYAAWFGALCLIVWATLRICQRTLAIKEGFLLNAYSTLINFFIPGQGGIAVRGIYLKKIKNIAIRKYIFITLIYYMFYAILSAALLLVGNGPWWHAVGALLIVSGGSLGIIYLYKGRSKTKTAELDLTLINLLYLALATTIQGLVQVAIYAVELHSTNAHIGLHQTIIYTGAANFALFVALTPGAIGIRETFLVFSQHLHHISGANIVAANVIDRAVFIVFLGILSLLTLGFHAKYRSLFRQPKTVIGPRA